jgi:very-short-patch-repair endonuclease
VVTRIQLYAAGFDRREIEHRLDNGYLHRRHRGVYLVGSPIPPPGGAELAAVLACGSEALIGHRSAVALWECLPGRAGPVERALRLIKDGDIEAAIDRAGNRKGVARMRRLVTLEGDRGYTRSKAERLMRRLLRDAALPQPLCNARIHGQKPDFLWPRERLVVQVDGYQFHGHRSAFERDRRKDQVLIAVGFRVVRVTWLQLQYEPLRVAAVIAAALTASRAPG